MLRFLELTQEEKDRIKAEELYRHEIRQQIEQSSVKKKEKIWGFLNSSFTLWFFSSVVIAGLTTFFAGKQNELSEVLKKSSIENRLNNEISYRISEALITINLKMASSDAQGIYEIAYSYLNNRVKDESGNVDLSKYNFSLCPEYQTRTFDSLIFELGTLIDKAQVLKLQKALQTYKSLEHLVDTANSEKIYNNEDINIAVAKLDSLQNISFWKSRLSLQNSLAEK
jgi:hypothetical protein